MMKSLIKGHLEQIATYSISVLNKRKMAAGINNQLMDDIYYAAKIPALPAEK